MIFFFSEVDEGNPLFRFFFLCNPKKTRPFRHSQSNPSPCTCPSSIAPFPSLTQMETSDGQTALQEQAKPQAGHYGGIATNVHERLGLQNLPNPQVLDLGFRPGPAILPAHQMGLLYRRSGPQDPSPDAKILAFLQLGVPSQGFQTRSVHLHHDARHIRRGGSDLLDAACLPAHDGEGRECGFRDLHLPHAVGLQVGGRRWSSSTLGGDEGCGVPPDHRIVHCLLEDTV